MKDKKQDSIEDENDTYDEEAYGELDLLERLETLREEMEELGMTTLEEVIARIEEMHLRLDSA